MWRLNRREGLRRRDRGAVSVVVALSLVIVMGFMALAIDLGSIYSNRQQLQNGADAAALAIAQSCQRGNCIDSADKYVKSNKLDGQAIGKSIDPSNGSARTVTPDSGWVTVEADSVHQNWFAGVMGQPTSAIRVRATAKWGYPIGGATLPLTFSWCEFRNATGGWDDQGKPISSAEVELKLKEKVCTNPAHNDVPGGFGWLDSTTCKATVKAGEWVGSDPGFSMPQSCKDFDWTTVLNKTVLIPIFQNYDDKGQNAKYQVKGLAAFTITAYNLGNKAEWPSQGAPPKGTIKGRFTNYTSLDGNYTSDPSAHHFGAGTVTLSG